MVYYITCNNYARKLIGILFMAVLVIGCFSSLTHQVKAETYNQIPLWINVMEGAAVDETGIEKQMDEIFKSNGLNWRVTSVVLETNARDTAKDQDQPGDVRVAEEGYTDEENSLWDKGKSETKNLSGFKIFVVRKILDENGTDKGVNGVSRASKGTAIIAQPSAREPPIGAGTWAHELGHLFGLKHENPDDSERPTDNLMYPYRKARNGTKLTPEDIAKMNATKMERDLGLPTLTPDQQNRTYDEYRDIAEDFVGDSFYPFTDIVDVLFGFFMLDSTKQFYITTFLNGMILPGVGLTYYVALDTDSNPLTGGDFMGRFGIDFLIEVYVKPPEVVEALLFKYPEHVPIAPLETRIDAHYKLFCTENPPIPQPVPDSSSIVVNMPLMMLVPLANNMSAYTFVRSDDGLGTDWLEKSIVSVMPPKRPELTLDPPTGPPGKTVKAIGSGFTPSHNVSIVFAHDTLSTAVVDLNGTFEANFTVPDLPSGNYVVDAIEQSSNVAVNVFTIESEANHDIAIIKVTSLKTVVGQGFTTYIMVTVENQGDLTETFNITAYYNQTAIMIEQWPDGANSQIFWSMGDVNRDGYINDWDVYIIGREFNKVCPPGENPADINSDGKVNVLDLNTCAKNYGKDIWTSLGVSKLTEAQKAVTLPSGNSTIITFRWNTTGVAKGNYSISAYAWPVPSETDTGDNTYTNGNIVVAMTADITGPTPNVPDGKVDMRDVAAVAKLFGVDFLDLEYNPNCDITGPTFGVPDGKTDMRDVSLVAKEFGKTG